MGAEPETRIDRTLRQIIIMTEFYTLAVIQHLSWILQLRNHIKCRDLLLLIPSLRANHPIACSGKPIVPAKGRATYMHSEHVSLKNTICLVCAA